MWAKRISFIAGIIHAIASVYYFSISWPLYSELQKLNLENVNFLAMNYPTLIFFLFVFIDFGFWNFLRAKTKRETENKHYLLYSVILLITPFIVVSSIGIYFTIKALNKIKQNL